MYLGHHGIRLSAGRVGVLRGPLPVRPYIILLEQVYPRRDMHRCRGVLLRHGGDQHLHRSVDPDHADADGLGPAFAAATEDHYHGAVCAWWSVSLWIPGGGGGGDILWFSKLTVDSASA